MAVLKDIPGVSNSLKYARKEVVEKIYFLLFEKTGKCKKDINNFGGLNFEKNSNQFKKKTSFVDKSFNVRDLTIIANVLGLEYELNKDELIQEILEKLCDLDSWMKDVLEKDENEEDEEDEDDDKDEEKDDDDGEEKDDDEDEEKDDDDKDGRRDSETGRNVDSEIKDDSEDEEEDERKEVATNYSSEEERSTKKSSAKKKEKKKEEAKKTETQRGFALSFRDIEDAIVRYDGTKYMSIESWIEEFEETASLMEWGDKEKFIYGRKALGGIARTFVLGESGLNNWKKLKKALKEEFKTRTNSAEIHKELSRRKMKENEDAMEYFMEMKKMARMGKVEDEALIWYVVEGVKDIVMCQRMCCALHALWGIIYTSAGSVQLVAGIFFLLSLPIFKLGSNIWTGACNVLIGVGTFMLSCFGDLTRPRSRRLLYLTLTALVVNVVNIAILEVGEWYLFMTKEVKDSIDRKNLHDLAFYARVSTSVTTAIVILIALADSQLTFCSMQFLRKTGLRHQNNNETVSDIEYIIPRSKTRSLSSNKTHSINNYTQSWVYDSETGPSLAESPALKMHPSAPLDPDSGCHSYTREQQHYSSTPVVRDNSGVVTVQVDDVSGPCGDGDRQINHMKSFSRTPSPAEASQSSSSSSIPPIYECLERLTQPTVYKNRLNTYKTSKDVSNRPGTKSRVQSGDKEHYASLMVELENSFSHKKEQKTTLYTIPPCSTSKNSTLYSTSLCNDSLTETIDSRQRGSDAEFSKELEAALKLIQDLESPNTLDTPSEGKAGDEDSRGKRRDSFNDKNDSDSTKTVSGASSLEAHGKNKRTLPVESQSTSGYNSPSLDRSSRLTPTTGISSSDLTVSQENGLSCVIRHLGDTAVISLFSPTKQPHPYSSVERVSDVPIEKEFLNGTDKGKRTTSLIELKTKNFDGEEKITRGKIRKWRYLIDKKRRPSLLPEVESAIIKSESLAFLSKSELKDRLNQTKSIHRQIERKVHRQRSLRKADSFGSVEDMIDSYKVSTCL